MIKKFLLLAFFSSSIVFSNNDSRYDFFIQENKVNFSDGSQLDLVTDIDPFTAETWDFILTKNLDHFYLVKLDNSEGVIFHEFSSFVKHYKSCKSDFFTGLKLKNISLFKISKESDKGVNLLKQESFEDVCELILSLESQHQSELIKILNESRSIESKVTMAQLYLKGFNVDSSFENNLLFLSCITSSKRAVQGIFYWSILQIKKSDPTFSLDNLIEIAESLSNCKSKVEIVKFFCDLSISSKLSDKEYSVWRFVSGAARFVLKDLDEAAISMNVASLDLNLPANIRSLIKYYLGLIDYTRFQAGSNAVNLDYYLKFKEVLEAKLFPAAFLNNVKFFYGASFLSIGKNDEFEQVFKDIDEDSLFPECKSTYYLFLVKYYSNLNYRKSVNKNKIDKFIDLIELGIFNNDLHSDLSHTAIEAFLNLDKNVSLKNRQRSRVKLLLGVLYNLRLKDDFKYLEDSNRYLKEAQKFRNTFNIKEQALLDLFSIFDTNEVSPLLKSILKQKVLPDILLAKAYYIMLMNLIVDKKLQGKEVLKLLNEALSLNIEDKALVASFNTLRAYFDFNEYKNFDLTRDRLLYSLSNISLLTKDLQVMTLALFSELLVMGSEIHGIAPNSNILTYNISNQLIKVAKSEIEGYCSYYAEGVVNSITALIKDFKGEEKHLGKFKKFLNEIDQLLIYHKDKLTREQIFFVQFKKAQIILQHFHDSLTPEEMQRYKITLDCACSMGKTFGLIDYDIVCAKYLLGRLYSGEFNTRDVQVEVNLEKAKNNFEDVAQDRCLSHKDKHNAFYNLGIINLLGLSSSGRNLTSALRCFAEAKISGQTSKQIEDSNEFIKQIRKELGSAFKLKSSKGLRALN